jgi:hypothetical protein
VPVLVAVLQVEPRTLLGAADGDANCRERGGTILQVKNHFIVYQFPVVIEQRVV